MRWVFLGAVALLACSGGAPFEGSEDDVVAKGGEAGETATGGALSGSGGAPAGGKSGSGGKAAGGTDSEGGEPATGGAETGGTGGVEPTGGTGTGGSAGCEELSIFYLDFDGDGYGRDEETVEACDPPTGYTDQGGDCADRHASNAAVNPGAAELCNHSDENCDGEFDEGGACPTGCAADGSGEVVCEAASWQEAAATCEEVGTSLARAFSSALGSTPNWLGASDIDGDGAWTWSDDGSAVAAESGFAWATGQPGAGQCMKFTAAGWASEDCEAELPFACVEP